jgi:glycosyltransferase involved in cell wall biosynthesis
MASASHNKMLVFAKGYLPDPGGIERYSADISEAYATMFDRVYVLTQTSVGPVVRRSGKVIVIDLGTGRQGLLFFKFLGAARRLLRRNKPTYMHATTWRLALPALLSGGKVPLAVTVHGREVFIVSRPLRPLLNLVLSRAAVVAVVSNAIRVAYGTGRSISMDNWTTVWNGLSFRNEAMQPLERPRRDTVRLFAFCRLVERKNIRGAIEALALLRQRGVGGFFLEVAGDGPDRADLERLVEQRGLTDVVRFLGYVSEGDVVASYRAADVFVHPQIAVQAGGDIEGFGLTIADAMSFGLAVVVGRDGGPSDFVMDGETGFVVDGNDVTAIADALEILVTSPERREEMGRCAQKWVLAELDWRRSASRVVAALEARS